MSIDRGLFYAVDIEDNIAAVFEIRSAPEKLWNNDSSKSLYIHKLAIHRQYSNREFGRNILELMKSKARGENLEFLRLDCIADNKKLREYYESSGFNMKSIVNTGKVKLALYEYNIQS